eukprot:evm.model.scf_588.2 EVM.evm.TU.scf_588.2   scf_588:43094-49272(+)
MRGYDRDQDTFRPAVLGFRRRGTVSTGGYRVIGREQHQYRQDGGHDHRRQSALDHRQDTHEESKEEDAAAKVAAANKLITNRWEFNIDISAKLLNDNTDFLVVGVIGGQGAGKSSILNSICGFSHFPKQSRGTAFPAAAYEQHLSGKHCTVGVDIRMSSDRVIALDTQPVLSASHLLELLDSPSPSMEISRALTVSSGRGTRPAEASAEGVQLIMAIQMAVFLFNVCHVVLVVSNWMGDNGLLDLIECVDMFAPNIAKGMSQAGVSRVPHQLAKAVFVKSNVPPIDWEASKVARVQRLLQNKIGESKFCIGGHVSCWSDTRLQMPKSLAYIQKKVMLDRLKLQILGINPSRKFDHGMTEREWFRWCESVWQGVQKDNIIAECYFRLQQTIFSGGGGW